MRHLRDHHPRVFRPLTMMPVLGAALALTVPVTAYELLTPSDVTPSRPVNAEVIHVDGDEMLQACLAREYEAGGASAVVSRSGWSVVEARQLEGIRARTNLGTRADPRPALVPAPSRYLVAGHTPVGDATAVCVVGGGHSSGYGLLAGSLGPTGVPARHVPAPVSASGIMSAEYDSVVYGWYAAGVSDITATVGGEPQTVVARNGFWSAIVLNPEQPSARQGPAFKAPPTVEVSGKTKDGDLVRSNRFASELIRMESCWAAAPTVGSKCATALPTD